MGGAGTATGLHSSIAPNHFVQVRGRKRWTVHPTWTAPFFAPVVACAPYFSSRVDLHDPVASPWADRIPGWTGVLEPGDVLWVPSFAWHQVANLTATVAVGYRWMSTWQGLRASWLQALIAATSTNPAPWRARGHKDLPELLDSIEY